MANPNTVVDTSVNSVKASVGLVQSHFNDLTNASLLQDTTQAVGSTALDAISQLKERLSQAFLTTQKVKLKSLLSLSDSASASSPRDLADMLNKSIPALENNFARLLVSSDFLQGIDVSNISSGKLFEIILQSYTQNATSSPEVQKALSQFKSIKNIASQLLTATSLYDVVDSMSLATEPTYAIKELTAAFSAVYMTGGGTSAQAVALASMLTMNLIKKLANIMVKPLKERVLNTEVTLPVFMIDTLSSIRERTKAQLWAEDNSLTNSDLWIVDKSFYSSVMSNLEWWDTYEDVVAQVDDIRSNILTHANRAQISVNQNLKNWIAESFLRKVTDKAIKTYGLTDLSTVAYTWYCNGQGVALRDYLGETDKEDVAGYLSYQIREEDMVSMSSDYVRLLDDSTSFYTNFQLQKIIVDYLVQDGCVADATTKSYNEYETSVNPTGDRGRFQYYNNLIIQYHKLLAALTGERRANIRETIPVIDYDDVSYTSFSNVYVDDDDTDETNNVYTSVISIQDDSTSSNMIELIEKEDPYIINRALSYQPMAKHFWNTDNEVICTEPNLQVVSQPSLILTASSDSAEYDEYMNELLDSFGSQDSDGVNNSKDYFYSNGSYLVSSSSGGGGRASKGWVKKIIYKIINLLRSQAAKDAQRNTSSALLAATGSISLYSSDFNSSSGAVNNTVSNSLDSKTLLSLANSDSSFKAELGNLLGTGAYDVASGLLAGKYCWPKIQDPNLNGKVSLWEFLDETGLDSMTWTARNPQPHWYRYWNQSDWEKPTWWKYWGTEHNSYWNDIATSNSDTGRQVSIRAWTAETSDKDPFTVFNTTHQMWLTRKNDYESALSQGASSLRYKNISEWLQDNPEPIIDEFYNGRAIDHAIWNAEKNSYTDSISSGNATPDVAKYPTYGLWVLDHPDPVESNYYNSYSEYKDALSHWEENYINNEVRASADVEVGSQYIDTHLLGRGMLLTQPLSFTSGDTWINQDAPVEIQGNQYYARKNAPERKYRYTIWGRKRRKVPLDTEVYYSGKATALWDYVTDSTAQFKKSLTREGWNPLPAKRASVITSPEMADISLSNKKTIPNFGYSNGVLDSQLASCAKAGVDYLKYPNKVKNHSALQIKSLMKFWKTYCNADESVNSANYYGFDLSNLNTIVPDAITYRARSYYSGWERYDDDDDSGYHWVSGYHTKSQSGSYDNFSNEANSLVRIDISHESDRDYYYSVDVISPYDFFFNNGATLDAQSYVVKITTVKKKKFFGWTYKKVKSTHYETKWKFTYTEPDAILVYPSTTDYLPDSLFLITTYNLFEKAGNSSAKPDDTSTVGFLSDKGDHLVLFKVNQDNYIHVAPPNLKGPATTQYSGGTVDQAITEHIYNRMPNSLKESLGTLRSKDRTRVRSINYYGKECWMYELNPIQVTLGNTAGAVLTDSEGNSLANTLLDSKPLSVPSGYLAGENVELSAISYGRKKGSLFRNLFRRNKLNQEDKISALALHVPSQLSYLKDSYIIPNIPQTENFSSYQVSWEYRANSGSVTLASYQTLLDGLEASAGKLLQDLIKNWPAIKYSDTVSLDSYSYYKTDAGTDNFSISNGNFLVDNSKVTSLTLQDSIKVTDIPKVLQPLIDSESTIFNLSKLSIFSGFQYSLLYLVRNMSKFKDICEIFSNINLDSVTRDECMRLDHYLGSFSESWFNLISSEEYERLLDSDKESDHEKAELLKSQALNGTAIFDSALQRLRDYLKAQLEGTESVDNDTSYLAFTEGDSNVTGNPDSLYMKRYLALNNRMHRQNGPAAQAAFYIHSRDKFLLNDSYSINKALSYRKVLASIPVSSMVPLEYIPSQEETSSTYEIHGTTYSAADGKDIAVGKYYSSEIMEKLKKNIHDKCMLVCAPCPVKDSCPYYSEEEVLKKYVPEVSTIDLYLKDNMLDLLVYDKDGGLSGVTSEDGHASIPTDVLHKAHKRYVEILLDENSQRTLTEVRDEISERVPGYYLGSNGKYIDDLGWLHGGRYGTLQDGLDEKGNASTSAKDKKYLYDALFIPDEESYIEYQESTHSYPVTVSIKNPGTSATTTTYSGNVKIYIPYNLAIFDQDDLDENSDVYLVSDDKLDDQSNPITPIIYLNTIKNLVYSFDLQDDGKTVGVQTDEDSTVYACDVAQWSLNIAKGMENSNDQYWMETLEKKVPSIDAATGHINTTVIRVPGRKREATSMVDTVENTDSITSADIMHGKPFMNQYINFLRKFTINMNSVVWVKNGSALEIETARATLPHMKTNLRLVVVARD